jgi:hypothetical protein
MLHPLVRSGFKRDFHCKKYWCEHVWELFLLKQTKLNKLITMKEVVDAVETAFKAFAHSVMFRCP